MSEAKPPEIGTLPFYRRMVDECLHEAGRYYATPTGTGYMQAAATFALCLEMQITRHEMNTRLRELGDIQKRRA
jgi:hypothetical protein